MTTAPVVLLVGLPAAGKSTVVKSLEAQGYTVLNRDTEGGTLLGLLRQFKALVGHQPVALDNLNLTADSRRPFIEAADAAGVAIECHWLQTSFEEAQVNALHRMYNRYGTCFMSAADIKAHPEAKDDPNMFPVAAMFAARKKLEGDKKAGIPSGIPTVAEGISRVVKVPFVRQAWPGQHKAVILDFDGTLRGDAMHHGGKFHYPTDPSQVQVLPHRAETLRRYIANGYKVIGISTQSGIGKGEVTEDMVRACFEETNRQLGGLLPLENIYYCPHHNFPVACFCRKPQAGLGVLVTRKYDLCPHDSIYVGDLGTDRTFAQRCGFQFAEAESFFRK